MASIERRNKSYRVRWRDPDGQSRSRQVPNKKTAYELAKEVEEAVARGRRWEPRDLCSEPLLEEVLKGFLRECARVLQPGTTVRYARALDLFKRYLERRSDMPARLTPALLSRALLAEWYDDLATGGLHDRPRKDATRRKLVEVVQLAWAWAYDDDLYGELVPRPRKLKMTREPPSLTVAPTWAEMDACIEETNGWHKHLAILLRFTGLRVQQAMHLEWADIDLDEGTLHVRPELGKSKQERRGRRVPLSPHLMETLLDWGSAEGFIIQSNRFREGPRAREARARDMLRAWKRTGARPQAYAQPHHCFRKGFVSELRRAGAESDAVEVLVGHSLGLRGVYTDATALPLREAVNSIPPMGGAGRVMRLVGRKQTTRTHSVPGVSRRHAQPKSIK